ncbi:MAG TPA: DUF6636 domain-containing protein [Longimicrobium sp.]|nr:DUF6636 domain-containing protein [Longimicrobium sp.]
MLLRFATLATAAVLTSLVVPDRASAGAQLHGFRTPSGNIGCMAANQDGRWELRCDIGEKEWSGPAVRDCELDTGDSMGMNATGRPYAVCHGDTVLGQGAALAYGTTWRAGPFNCTSQRTGVTCRNRAQHGFTLSRTSYRMF